MRRVRRLEELGHVARPAPVAGATRLRGRRFAGRKSTGGEPARFRLSVSGGRASRKIEAPFSSSASRWIRPDVRARCRRSSAAARPPRARPDRGEDGRLAARRLADERAHRAGLELELPRRAVALHRDPLKWRHRPTVPRASRVHGGIPRHPAPEEAARSAGAARRPRGPPDRRADGRARRHRST